MEKLDETPEYIKEIIKDLHQDPYLKIKDYDLRQRGIEPSQISRWFKKHHNITFHAYHRQLKINSAFNSINSGISVTSSAFDSGYESLSGFNDSYRSVFGDPPTNTNDKTVLNIIRFTSPVGPMFACASKKGTNSLIVECWKRSLKIYVNGLMQLFYLEKIHILIIFKKR